MVDRFPAERWLVIEDNLSTHASRNVQLALPPWPEIHVQFLPKYASWLNLIEPWWRQFKSLALKGRRFEIAEEIEQAVERALTHWTFIGDRTSGGRSRMPSQLRHLAGLGLS